MARKYDTTVVREVNGGGGVCGCVPHHSFF